MDKIIICGPFVGSFFEEVTNFRPFVQWVSRNILYKDIFVLSHYNRQFLYSEKMIPIQEQYSFDDDSMNIHLNSNIDTRTYNSISKILKDDILDSTGYKLKDIIFLFNKYPKNKIKIPLHNKEFVKIELPDVDDIISDDTIIFIPSKIEDEEAINKILDSLQSNHNVVILGDNNIYFEEDNILNSSYDILLNRYEYIIKILSKAKLVICPVSDWTFLCNLQKVPVMSWGDDINFYKNGGLYGFNNNNHIIPQTKPDNIISAIEYFLKEIS